LKPAVTTNFVDMINVVSNKPTQHNTS